eukprot:TRINITY_DN3553_c0_g1_i2.p1 TRINITY_DN3553_c0_g1~~TRINITY_DN3553_c0_g1_i2.p1  ORF type:complete len:496 (-),score=92.11 TRINITY_DN3553_c0_g1_i2:368-1855(-)
MAAQGSRSHVSPTVLVIGCGIRATSQSMFEKMYQRGLRTVVVAHEDAWISSLVSSGTVDACINVPGIWDAAQTEELAGLVLQKLSDAGVVRIDAVYNVYYHYLLLAGRVANRLGCISNSIDAIETCIFKSKARKCLISAGLERWNHFSFRTMDELEQLITVMDYPAVLKPAESSGSWGVVRVDSPSDAIAQFSKLLLEPWCQTHEVEFILENYIDGPEFGVELIMQEGEIIFSSIMDAGKQTNSIFFQGTSRSFPSNLPLSIQEATMQHCFSAVKALGLTTGVLDIDIRYSDAHGPRIIEVNPRMGGGSVELMHQLAYGVDLTAADLNTSLGLSMADELAAWKSFSGEASLSTCFEVGWLMSPYSGEVQNMSSFMENLKTVFGNDACVMSISALVQDGKKAIGYQTDGLPTCLIQVVTSGASKSLALEHLSMILRTAENRISELVALPEKVPAKVDRHELFVDGQISDGEAAQESEGETVASHSDLIQTMMPLDR